MSSTLRGTKRADLDAYPSPRWTVHRLLDAYHFPGGLWVEPCAGAGNIIRAVRTHQPQLPFSPSAAQDRASIQWAANEINPAYERHLVHTPGVRSVQIGDVLEYTPPDAASVIITNPPFSIAGAILERFYLSHGPARPPWLLVLLQRLNWCAGPRAAIFRAIQPSVYVLPERPSFRDSTYVNKDGVEKMSSTDSIEYAWFVFDGLGRFVVLDSTPDAVRAEEKRERRAGLILESKSLDSSAGEE